MFSLAEFAKQSDMSQQECAEALATFVASGVLRKTQTENCEIYYWLAEDRSAKRPQASDHQSASRPD